MQAGAVTIVKIVKQYGGPLARAGDMAFDEIL